MIDYVTLRVHRRFDTWALITCVRCEGITLLVRSMQYRRHLAAHQATALRRRGCSSKNVHRSVGQPRVAISRCGALETPANADACVTS